VGVGGEHSVSIGLVQAMAQRFTDLSVLHLDAHADTREEYEGSRYNHACVMSRIGEVCPYVQAGVRSMAASERSRYRPDRTFFARDILRHPAVAHEIVAGLTSQVYLSIDLDVFDPSIMPSTGTPEPGGLDWHTVMDLLEPVIQQREVVGMDLTELLPNSQNRAPDFLAAKLVYRILSMVFAKNEE
jgi:agmatinase